MIEHFAYGWTTPVIACAVSFLGSLIGLQAAGRARYSQGRVRTGWLVLAAFTLGTAAIWAMHFIAMLGFSVESATLRYDVPLTVLSGLLAVAVVGVGLFWSMMWRPGWTAVLGGGIIMGLGVVTMHYMGMASIRMQGEMHHDPRYTATAAAVALVASTLALLFALRLRGLLAIVLASLVMAAAVATMHYTAMFGMSVTAAPESPLDTPVTGATMMDFFMPMFVGLGLLLMIISLILLLSPAENRTDPATDRAPAHTADPSVFTRRP
ncbi:MHYT domain-containing protein [Streptomonospora salina]|uniref:NO-binding membrane sensor protein with MHYT domain n=1 Tax=Streptomonospora salina TaxID=104205 RepID=A0A841DZJ7_9ACTN|nr:MHYT domain-containing protein [Streptomonospora salina]MBB5996295.1 NO-binding membrane sensor protein with MHYT domain [Streptomonospora salina]